MHNNSSAKYSCLHADVVAADELQLCMHACHAEACTAYSTRPDVVSHRSQGGSMYTLRPPAKPCLYAKSAKRLNAQIMKGLRAQDPENLTPWTLPQATASGISFSAEPSHTHVLTHSWLRPSLACPPCSSVTEPAGLLHLPPVEAGALTQPSKSPACGTLPQEPHKSIGRNGCKKGMYARFLQLCPRYADCHSEDQPRV